MCKSVFGILFDVQMWEQSEVLQNISDTAFGHWNLNVRLLIEQYPPTHGNSPGIWSCQPSHTVEQRGLARSRRAKQYSESRRGAELNIQRELALRRGKALANACGES